MPLVWIWDMFPLNGQNPRRAGEDSPPERRARDRAPSSSLLLSGRFPRCPALRKVLPAWKMCQEAVAPLDGVGARLLSTGGTGVAWKRWVSSVHCEPGERARTVRMRARPHPSHPSPSPCAAADVAAGLGRGVAVGAPLGGQEGGRLREGRGATPPAGCGVAVPVLLSSVLG